MILFNCKQIKDAHHVYLLVGMTALWFLLRWKWHCSTWAYETAPEHIWVATLEADHVTAKGKDIL